MKKITNKQRLQQLRTKQSLLLLSVILAVCLVAAYGIIKMMAPAQPQRLVRFYDRGIEQSILTTASTVQGALIAAAIEVDPHDIVEPTADTPLTESYVDIIIYRSRPVAVIDGAIRQTIMTSSQSPNSMLKEAGLSELGPKDKTTFKQSDLVMGGARIDLVVSRAEIEKPAPIVFQPKPNALTSSKGAHVYVDKDGVAHRETYYDLLMNVVIRSCGVTNTYSIRPDGAKVDQDGYILVAANLAAYPRCTVVDTSMGPGKVYDTGGFAVRHPYGFDLATDWSNNDGR
ncbi:MAG TPA: ubiquitin-like domain-containing protein [Candidatus Saccharimonadales bacterium]